VRQQKIEKMMKADVPQIISNMKHKNTKSLALEIRVPVEFEQTYLNILDRLNERASTLKNGEVELCKAKPSATIQLFDEKTKH
jgi:hypothetical protein